MNYSKELHFLSKYGPILGSLVVAGVYGINNGIYNVDGGERAVIFSRFGGVKSTIIAEGTHFCIPWVQWPIIFDTRAKVKRIASPTGSKDLQTVNITMRILCRPDKKKLHLITKEIGTDWDEKILPSICNEVLKSVVAQFNASQLNTQREMVSKLIFQHLSERANEFHIILDDCSITEINFSSVYMASVEAKQIAQQEAQRAQFTVETAKQEAQRKIVRAEGEAKAIELIGKQISTNQGYLQSKRIDTAVAVSKIIARSNNKVMLNAEQLLMNFSDAK